MAELDVQEALTRKLGPLPTWAWAGVAAGALILFRVVKGGSRNSTIPAVGGNPDFGTGGGGSGSTSDLADNPGTTPATTPGLTIDQLRAQLQTVMGNYNVTLNKIAEFNTTIARIQARLQSPTETTAQRAEDQAKLANFQTYLANRQKEAIRQRARISLLQGQINTSMGGTT